VNHSNFVYLHIKPYAEKVCANWCGLYGGRRGVATTMLALYGLPSVPESLGNTLATVIKKYAKNIEVEGRKGRAALEADYLKRRSERSAANGQSFESTL
jgi:hypothetical protein